MEKDNVGVSLIEAQNPLPVFQENLKCWVSYFEDEKCWDSDACRARGLEQALHPTPLETYGIASDGHLLKKNCNEIVKFLWKNGYQKSFASWLVNYDEDGEFLASDNDPIVIKISKIGQTMFKKAKIDYKQLAKI